MNRFKALLSATLLTATGLTANGQYIPSDENLAAREEFRDSGFGIFIHWGIYSMLGSGEWVLNRDEVTLSEYENLPAGFYPSRFDADKWVKDFKDSGAEYITITSRHHDGFSMFATKQSDYNIVDATPFKRDILKEISEACQHHGLKLHIYYSHLDWRRDDYVPLGRTGHDPGRKLDGQWNDYITFMNNQLTELLTEYGPIGAIWFDGLWDRDEIPGGMEPEQWNLPEQYSLIHQLQPACLIGNNHHSTPIPGEDMQIFERDKPGENTAGLSGQEISLLPLETCQTMNRSWGYRITDNDYKSSEDLIRYLIETAGNDANLLLNIGPRPDGSLPEEAVERLHDMGKWMADYATTVKGVRGGPVAPHEWGVTTHRDRTMYVHILNGSDKALFIPYTGNKLISAKCFADGKPIRSTQTNDGIIIDISNRPDVIDHVVELTFKSPIK